MALTLDQLIEGLITARDAVNAVPGRSFPELWVDNEPWKIQDVISDVNGVAIIAEDA